MKNKKIPINIIYDTREQQPLEFVTYSQVYLQRDKLDCADYTLTCHDMPNDDDSVCIERKMDCQELVKNLVAEWQTFSKVLENMSQYKHKFIVVCSNNNFSWIYQKGYTKVSPAFAHRRLLECYLKYGVSTIFAGNREGAELFIYQLFKQIRERHEEE